jgi:SET domain-containing protein
MVHSEAIEVKLVSGKGRGVFARRLLSSGSVIEKVPVLLVPIQQIAGGWDNPGLMSFFFVWNHATLAVCLGYGSLYNHSYTPNARYVEVGTDVMAFVALRDIGPGEEVTINYNGDPADRTPMPFSVV